MRTEDLIARLGEEATPVAPGFVNRRLAAAVGVGAAVAVAACVAVLGLRPDLAAALGTGAFWMKAGYTLVLAVIGYRSVERLSRPGLRAQGTPVALAVAVAVLALLAVVQLLGAEPAARAGMVLGRSWRQCPFNILFVTAFVLPGLLWVMRGLAPTRPGAAGAAAGLLAGAAGATVYGLHCTESTAAFLLVWYSLGVAMAAGVGALAGRFALRW